MEVSHMYDKKDSEVKYGPNYIGNVIRIVDEYTVIINIGKDSGEPLKVGSIIQVYEPGEEIKDLDGSVIARFEHVKGELRVVRTESTYSICKSNKTTTKNATVFALSPLLEGRTITETAPLTIDNANIEPLEIRDPVIRIGDPVKFA